jgi:hypothetical protein
LLGLVGGSVFFAVLRGGPSFAGYGWLTDVFHGASAVWIAPILLAAGLLIGFGAKRARGCTSGNGLERQRDRLAGEPRGHRDLLRHRDRREFAIGAVI